MLRQLAVLTALILPASACGPLGTAHPALTKTQAAQILANYQSVNNRANADLDGGLLATVETGAQLEMDRAGYRLRRAKKDKYTAFAYARPAFYIPRQDGFPKWFAVDAASGDTRHALLFVQDRAGGPWLLAADPFPSSGLSGVDLDKDGYATAVSPTDGGTAVQPSKVAGVHAATLSSGTGGMAPGPYTSESRDALTKVEAALRKRGVTLTSDFAPDQQRSFALRTTGGGALVWYVVRQSERYDMVDPGTVSADGDLAGLVRGRVGHHLSSVALIQYLAVVPDHGSTQVIGTYRKAVQATTS
ncbi:hypothetical protein [Actinomadura sp. DC4]|uniref:hypothetical protein n=1 Tax=Actinomadura sp. DC4 TaxID=3055069 RepID=UPI0025B183EB|nr:hypothetical protein [Actinomadura sp. DC4]MDN3355607.1 hypothetical protein [Actinomadura sp. DC4]